MWSVPGASICMHHLMLLFMILYRTSPWLLAMTMVGLTQASHDLLREESFFTKLFSDSCSIDCKNQQISK